MNAAPADQRRLVDLAELDTRLRQTEEVRRTPPQAQRVQELLARRQTLAHELSQRTGARDDVKTELGRVHSDVEVVEARRARDEKLLATVSNPKDAVGLEHELASLKKRQSDLEDAELELMERLEAADAAVAEQERLIAAVNAEGAELSAQAKAVVADATGLIEQLQRDRAALRAAVPDELIAQYDRIAQRGVGAAVLQDSTCTGCRMLLSGSDLQAVRTAPADAVVTCPECGCILVRE